MSGFFDDEAVVSEGSEDEEVREEMRRSKKLKKLKSLEDSDEEEEDDDDDRIREEMKDLINDDVEEEEDSEDEIGRGDKRKHEEDEPLASDLEEDDYDLINENLGQKVFTAKKKFRRVRPLEDDDEDEDERRNDRDVIADQLFNHEEEPTSRNDRRDSRLDDQFGNIDSEQSESEEDNFIVDDNDQPISRPRHRKGADGINDQSMREAREIFGDGFDYDDVINYDEMEDIDEEEDEYEGEGEYDEHRREAKKKKKRAPKKSIFEIYEPAELERSHLTELDHEIRNKDLPERFQLRSCPVTQCEHSEIQDEAEWIYRNLFEMPSITRQDKNTSYRLPLGGPKQRSVIFPLQEVLHYMRNDQLDIPFIIHYRKEYYQPELDDNDLWLVYKWDEKWCQLQERKNNLIKMLEKTREFHVEQMAEWNQKEEDRKRKMEAWERWDNDKRRREEEEGFGENGLGEEPPKPGEPDPKPEFRYINDRDLARVRAVQSFEEFSDCHYHYQLYYGQDVAKMKELECKRKQEEKQSELEQRRRMRQEMAEMPEEERTSMMDEEEEEALHIKEMDELNRRLAIVKLSKKRDTYALCCNFGIGKMVEKFGLTPEQFGEHLIEGYSINEIAQSDLEPIEAARELISKRFDTPEKVLQAATFMVGKQLAADPTVRRIVRQVFYDRAKINVRPTKKGRKEIDENHPCYTFKYLTNKLITNLSNDQFLQLHVAQKEELINYTIFMDDESLAPPNQSSRQTSTYLDEIKNLYYLDEFTKHVQNWNEHRTKALEIALNRFLYPCFIKEVTNKMLYEAQFTIIQQSARKMAAHLSIAPYTFNAEECDAVNDDDFDTRDGLRIMGLAIMPTNEEASYCALIDGEGEVTDWLKLEHFMLKRGGGYLNEKEKSYRNRDREKLKRFILQKKPHVIALGCDTIVTRDVMDDLISIVKELHDMEGFPNIPIEYVDSELSTVYMNSKRAATDFFTFPPKLRQAISLARRLQDPLIEFSQLCTADEEIMCLKFHTLQDNVPREELLSTLYQEFATRVNEVGVDINRCLVHPHTASLVQFIAGLGPRKGAFLLRQLKKLQTPLLENRTQLVQNCNVGKIIFINCSGFIKIDTNSFADSGTDTYIEVLDSTRVHPEAYEWARKMAVDALDYDEDNETGPAQALDEIMENPEKLRDLDLDEFAKELKRQGMGLKKQTLYDIRAELTDRYQERRRPYTRPSIEEIFTMLTGESAETLYPGKMIQVRVTGVVRRRPKTEQVDQAQPIRLDNGQWKCPFCAKDDFAELGEVWNHFDTNLCPGQAFGVRARLDNGLSGMIPTKLLSDKDVTDPLTRVKVGMTINCRVIKVLMDRFSLDLTSRSSDLIDVQGRYKLPKDRDYDYETEKNDREKEEEAKKRNTRQRTYMKRIIVHPSFQNIDFRKAEKFLSESAQGEAVIRPSSKGANHLTLSWKVHDGIHHHVDIREENKANEFSLGRQLFINNESFEDLDEIIARYVQPMASFAREFINFKYFRDLNGDRAQAERMLSEEKQKAPSRIPYIVSASKEFPGKFLLSYQPNTKAFHEFITVTHEGFRYRNNNFKTINALFKWFKQHFNDYSTFPRTPGQITPVNASPYIAQRTPVAQNSPYVGSNKQPFVPTPNINAQAIQRAAAAMPNHIFKVAQHTLSQVAQQTPSFGTPNNFAGRQGVYAGSMPPPPAPPNPFATQAMLAASSAMPPPPPPPPLGRPSSRSGAQWSEIIQQQDWQQQGGRRSGAPLKPRTPIYATPGAGSAMSISPLPDETPVVRGDQTPLVDEWNAY